MKSKHQHQTMPSPSCTKFFFSASFFGKLFATKMGSISNYKIKPLNETPKQTDWFDWLEAANSCGTISTKHCDFDRATVPFSIILDNIFGFSISVSVLLLRCWFFFGARPYSKNLKQNVLQTKATNATRTRLWNFSKEMFRLILESGIFQRRRWIQKFTAH